MLDENDDTTTPSNDLAPEPTAAEPTAAEPTGTDPAPDSVPAAAPAEDAPADSAEAPAPVKRAPRKRTTRTTTTKRTGTKKAAAADTDQPSLSVESTDRPGDQPAGADAAPEAPVGEAGSGEDAPVAPRKRTTRKTTAKKVAAKKAPTKRATKKSASADPAAETAATDADVAARIDADPGAPGSDDTDPDVLSALIVGPADPVPDPLAGPGTPGAGTADEQSALELERPAAPAAASAAPSLLFKAPDPVSPRTRRRVSSTPVPAPADEGSEDTDDAEVVAESDVAGLQQVPDEVSAGDDTPDGSGENDDTDDSTDADDSDDNSDDSDDSTDADDSGEGQGGRRRRRRGGRRRRRSGGGDDTESESTGDQQSEADDQSGEGDDSTGGGRGSGQRGGRGSRQKQDGQSQDGQKQDAQKQDGQKAADKRGGDTSGPDDEPEADEQSEGTGSRRRRRRRRTGEDSDGDQDSQNTVTRVRKPRSAEDEITALHGSTRLEAKKQRRREGREAGRRRAPIVSEAEFLARREAVDRVMVIRQRADLTQIAVLEDQVLVEHYVARESQTSLIGNVYLGRVQNVLPSMEAAFIDIGKGRNAVLYAGEVNWDSLGAGNGPRKIESVLKSGQPILVQVSKDPIGHKGARLTSQISLPGRFLVYVPDGTTSGISRKLPDTERTRLKTLLKEIVPDSAGVIVRTAAEGASEAELTLDVERLTARWADIETKMEKAKDKSGGPQLLYGEPDLTLKVVRDLFTEDFAKLVVSGDDAWDMVDTYVKHVAPDLEERLERYSDSAQDVFADYRIDEQIAKGLDRKVWLPSGGSLIIDRTEAMTVVDVNTGKFTGSGGNLEETVTKNNLEAAEEMIRQLRLRDIGGIIVVDFIDMVLESNRDLVLRRLVECLGRDRTRHQVAEVTSLGLVQMTRKRIGTGLLEAFSESCEHCQGRGLVVHHEPVESNRGGQDDEPRRGRRGRNRGSDGPDNGSSGGNGRPAVTPRPSPSPKDIAAIAKHDHRPVDEPSRPVEPVETTGPVETAQPVETARPVETTQPVEPVETVQPTEPVETAQPTEQLSTGTPDRETADPVVGADESPADESVAPVATGPAQPEAAQDEPAQPGSVQPEPQAPPAPKGPILVTSTRRRVARRPAGSAAPAPRPDAAAAPGPVQVTTPVAADVQPAPNGAPAHPAPVLVTSTRRQVVRRPAGPPVGSTPGAPEPVETPLSDAANAAVHEQRVDEREDDGASDVPAPDSEDHPDDHPESVHVPVKKKGSRKR